MQRVLIFSKSTAHLKSAFNVQSRLYALEVTRSGLSQGSGEVIECRLISSIVSTSRLVLAHILAHITTPREAVMKAIQVCSVASAKRDSRAIRGSSVPSVLLSAPM